VEPPSYGFSGPSSLALRDARMAPSESSIRLGVDKAILIYGPGGGGGRMPPGHYLVYRTQRPKYRDMKKD
jgi:hypothetical protein